MRIKKKEVQSEIFTGSMADISFLLIIYFMITSAFSADRGLDFALPEDTDTPEIKQEDSIDVHVLRGGVIEVDAKGMPLEGLLPYCLEKLKQNPEKPVILQDGIVGNRQRMTAWSGYRGNVFHRWRVWSSMPTGTPLVFVAQWRVVPLQISAPVS